jgi:cell division protein FtsI/penicillin-binding protein 2
MTRVYQYYQRRIALLALLVIIAWAGLGFKLFSIQVLEGKTYNSQSHRQGQAKEILPALRGNIFDTNGIPLTRNIIHYTIAADPDKIDDAAKIAKELSSITGKPSKYYTKKLSENGHFVYLERNLRKKYASSIIEKNFDGLIIQRHARRSYPHENISGQLVGFTDIDDKGLGGIENIHDNYLNGTDGWIVKQRTGIGDVNLRNNYPKEDPIDGSNINLTINFEYQTVLHEELQKQLKRTDAESATGIIVNPQTGAILAIASVPDFDPNSPAKYPTENQKLRAITDQFEPGSTYKIVAATAAIERNIVDVDEKFDCEDGKFKFNDLEITDHKPHDVLTFGQIIEQSSNIGIIKVASKVGKSSLHKYSQEFGFGSSTNIGLGGESSGTLRKLSDWSPVSIAEVSMGHEVGISVLQLAMAYSAVANDGILLRPYVINNIENYLGKSVYSNGAQVVRKIANQDVMDTLTELLVNAVEKGTGTEAFIPGWQVAGKTGTAQKYINGTYSNTKFVSNFVGFLPASDPQLLCVITLDEPRLGYHWGGKGAAPVFKKVMQRIINLDDSIKPPKDGFFDVDDSQPILVDKKLTISKNIISEEPILLSSAAAYKNTNKINNSNIKNGEVVIPNVQGMSLKKAISTLNQAGLQSKFAGSGKVIWQSPKPGTISKTGTVCSIGLE